MARQKMAVKSTTVRPEFKRAQEYKGLYSRVAAALQLEVSHVRRVALGFRQSARVEQALLREIKRIERITSAA